jgi:hypothetical protein
MKKIIIGFIFFLPCYIEAVLKKKIYRPTVKVAYNNNFNRTRDIIRKDAPRFKFRNLPFTISTL